MSKNISLFHPQLCHLDYTEAPHSLGAPLIDGAVYVGTQAQEYPKSRIKVGIEASGIWIEREDEDTDLQIIVTPRRINNHEFDAAPKYDKPAPAELLVTPIRRLVLARSAMSGYVSIPKDVMRPEGLEDLREFADILAGRVIHAQRRLARAAQ